MPRADILVVGQGLAGTTLAYALEAAGFTCAIADAGHAGAASAIAAGIMNPITGRRLVQTWHAGELLPMAAAMYGDMERAYTAGFYRRVRIRRLFADEREHATFHAKYRDGEFGGFVRAYDEAGFWIEEAARIDVATLLGAARRYWLRQGRLREAIAAPIDALGDYGLVIDCRGEATTRDAPFGYVPWAYSKGEMLGIRSTGLSPEIVLNRRRWLAAVDPHHGWVGATHEPGVVDQRPTAHGRAALEACARDLLQRDFEVIRHVGGVRVTVPDKMPVAGTHPQEPRLGIVNALGAKGATFAPWLARQWIAHLTTGAPFDPAVDLARFNANREQPRRSTG